VNEAIKKARNKAENEKYTAEKQSLIEKGTALRVTKQKLDTLIYNKFQPAPDIVEEENKEN